MRKLVLGIIAVVLGGLLVSVPVWADCPEGCVQTAILGKDGCSCLDAGGDGLGGVGEILTLVVRIMTVGVGILAAIGITVFGIQYLTAADDEGKVKKAKVRMFQIVLGLAIYVTIIAILQWLLPDFHPLGG